MDLLGEAGVTTLLFGNINELVNILRTET
jgi:hypothetical protein